ncbi:MAG: phosphoenolpyruvate carboxykinase (ATP) [Armatimonadetes bacterium]|nr:phosphoenolpyruvate carboxykinase (ATP) [Armatimonadota bacterium]
MPDTQRPVHGLEHHGIRNVGRVYWTLPTAQLYEQVIRRREGLLAHLGPIVVRTGHTTGRSPNDKFIVQEEVSGDKINWDGEVNRPISEEHYQKLYNHMLSYIQGRDLFVQDCYVGADPQYRLPIRVITEDAWQSLFARNMFIQIKDREELLNHVPQFRIISLPGLHAQPPEDYGVASETFIIVNFKERTVLIGATRYGGEIKKSVFTIMNYLLPQSEVLSMHCSANVGNQGDVALFFGLSGTGKTTLSADPRRALIGDDEHGWSENGIFNFEGGCYAKVIHLSREAEPQIYECTRKFGTIMENVMVDFETRRVDLDDDSFTENTRAAYPLTHLDNIVRGGVAGHPRNIVFLTCDAFGVMPPVARLNPDQAMYHFLSGYTAKVAGTVVGINEPKPAFSACFGSPFMALHPGVYANMLGERIRKHKVNVWLVNTGWTGGPYGVGHRINIGLTRTILNAAINGDLDDVPMRQDPFFGFDVPTHCPDVETRLLDPKNTWGDPTGYDEAARKLCAAFRKNFSSFESGVSPEVIAAAPPG